MKRHELEHIIRAAADIADDNEIVVIGTQTPLSDSMASRPLAFIEADFAPRGSP